MSKNWDDALKASPLTPKDMQDWLTQEIQDLSKAIQLRIQEATNFVTAYSTGQISPDAAMDRLNQYTARWGDSPIPGIVTDKSWSDDEILKQLDDARKSATRRIIEERANENPGLHPKRGSTR